MAIAPSPTYDEVLEFLVSAPTPEQIIAFHASDLTQAQVRDLLEANQNNVLTPEQAAELDQFEQVNHLVSLLKIYARQRLKAQK